MVDYIARHYTADRIVVAAAGKVDHDDFVRRAGDAFGSTEGAAGFAPEPAVYAGGDSREVRTQEQLHLLVGLEGIPNAGSRLLRAGGVFGGAGRRPVVAPVPGHPRGARGLVYSIYSFNSSYADSGLFGVYAGTGADSASEVVERVCANLTTLAGDISEAELQRAKAQLKAGILMSLESTAARAEQIARHTLIFDRVLPTEEVAEAVDAVGRESVARISGRLRAGRPTVAILGPEAAIPAYEEIAAALS